MDDAGWHVAGNVLHLAAEALERETTMTHGVNAARCLTQATEAALAGDYHKATALTGIAIYHRMAHPYPRIQVLPMPL